MSAAATASDVLGAGFLLGPQSDAFTPEDFTEEHRQVKAQSDRLMADEVLPNVERYEQKDADLARSLLAKCGEIGLLGILVPEKYDGMELDLTSQLLVAESMGRYAAFSTTYGAHSGIGTLPLVFFGTDELKRKYLPKMVTGELVAAYALSEPQAGSDALAARTRADLSDDGKHYVLNGQKMWISNGGWADVYTVFAKVGGEKFTAFLVERAWDGVRPGAEERKMGIHGSSTTAVFLDNVKVPVENVLGEVGRGHIIAFNILNMGRLKLGASCVGGAKAVLAESAAYARQRQAFGKPIAEFGAIRSKLAEGAAKLYAAESTAYRIGGLIDSRLQGLNWDAPDAAQTVLKAIEEYAVECSIAKVYGSETLDYVVDEGVQIHGGYGFHQDYMVERGYRDSRINRIYEGTNEINRLLTTGMILKRGGQGRLPLMNRVLELNGKLSEGESTIEAGSGPLAAEAARIEAAKQVAVLGMGLAFQRFGSTLEEEQEVNMALADIIISAYAMESALLRTNKVIAGGGGEHETALTRFVVAREMRTVESAAMDFLPACAEGEKLERYSGVLRKLLRAAPVDTVALRREIARHVLS